MADAITGLIGAVFMAFFLVVIAMKIGETPLWIVCLIGISLMTWALWKDDIEPLVGRSSD